jgi:hypothetical protein
MNAYEKRIHEEIRNLISAYVASVLDEDDYAQLLDELTRFVSEETRRSYVSGLKANDRRGRGQRRPGEVRSAVQNGKLHPVPQEEGA